MNDNILTVSKGPDRLKVEIRGTLEDVMDSFEAICQSSLEAVKIHTQSKGQQKAAQIELMDRYLKTFMQENPTGLLILYDQFTNGILDSIKGVEECKPKKDFLETMMSIITKSFKDFEKDLGKND